MGLFGGGGDAPDYGEAIALMQQEKAAAEGRINPWIEGGQAANTQLMAQLGLGGGQAFDVTQLPGYQRSLEQGLSAVNQAGAGAGMLMSGQRLKGLQQAGQDVFGQYYGDYMNRITGLGSQGLGAATNLSQMGLGAAGNMSNMMMQQAQQEAAAEAAGRADMMGTLGSLGGMAAGHMLAPGIGGGIGSSIGGSLMGGGGMGASSQAAQGMAPAGQFNLASMGGF